MTATYGDTGVKIEASVTTGDGTLSYAVKSGDAVTVDVTTGALTIVKAGTATVTVTAAGTDTYAQATKDVTVTVGRKALIITADSASKMYDGAALTKNSYTNTALVSSDSIESVAVAGTQTYVGSSDNVPSAAVIKNGDTDVTANYEITYANGTLTITDRDAKYEITVKANSDTVTYDGQPRTVSGFETLEYTVSGVTYTVSGLSATATGTDAGIYPVDVTGTAVVKDASNHDLTAQFIVNTENGSLTINKRSVTLTSATQERQYNGSTLADNTVTVTGDGWATDEGATYNVTGSQRLVGASDNTFDYTLNDGTKADNYTITTRTGTLTVTSRTAKYEISPQAKSDAVTYDGQAHSVSEFVTDTFTVENNVYTVTGLTASGTGTDADSYTVSVSGTAVVKDSSGNDVTDQFSVTPLTGTLSITKREVTLTSATDAKEYDGTALTNSNVTVTGDGWATGEGATYNVTGTRTLVGTSDNTFTYTLNDNTKADNYTITTNNGTLTVTNRDTKYTVMLTANSDTVLYDGTTKTVTGYAVTGHTDGMAENVFEAENGQLYTISGMSAARTETDAGSYDITVTGTPVVRDAGGNDVTDQFSVTPQAGTLTINKRAVTLTSATDSRAYTGTALTNSNVTVTGDGWATGEGATYDVTGSQTLPGNSANAFTYTLNAGTKAENYEITKTEGTLTITNRNDEEPDKKYEIAVKANSDTVTYDGQPHTVSGFETLEYTVDGVTYTVSGLSATATGTNAGTYPVNVTGTAVVKDASNHDLTAQFIVNTENGSLTINQTKIADANVAIDAYQYGTTVPAPVVTGTLVGGDETKNVTCYYKATAFLKSETEDVTTLENAKGVYKTLDPMTFEPGMHYVLAVISGDNYSNPYVTQSVFEVTQNTVTERNAPAAPAVEGTTVTAAEGDRAKSLEYSLDGETWLGVTLDKDGKFDAAWAKPVTDATLSIRETADERYARPSASASGTATITTTTYTVTYDANGGVNPPAVVTVTAGRTVTISGQQNMTRTGYRFTGWNSKANGGGTPYVAGGTVNSGRTLYAQWTPNTYTVRFNANGGTGTMEDQRKDKRCSLSQHRLAPRGDDKGSR